MAIGMAEAATWEAVVHALKCTGCATIAVVGGCDTGKTAFCAHLLGTLSCEGKVSAFVDADVGQSTVGPPGAVSLSLVHGAFVSFGYLAPSELRFIGDISPSGHVDAMASAVQQLVDASRKRGARVCVLDTTGLFHGAEGSELKRRKLEAIEPDHVVVLASHTEPHRSALELAPEGVRLFQVAASPCVRVRSPAERVAYRYRRFERYFHGGSRVLVRPDGATLAWCRQAGREGRLHGLLVGLLAGDEGMLALGVAIRLLEPDLVVFAPEFAPDEVERIELGSFALDPQQMGALGF